MFLRRVSAEPNGRRTTSVKSEKSGRICDQDSIDLFLAEVPAAHHRNNITVNVPVPVAAKLRLPCALADVVGDDDLLEMPGVNERADRRDAAELCGAGSG